MGCVYGTPPTNAAECNRAAAHITRKCSVIVVNADDVGGGWKPRESRGNARVARSRTRCRDEILITADFSHPLHSPRGIFMCAKR